MKNKFSVLFAGTLLLVFGFGLIACGGDDEDGFDSALVGTWS